MASTVKLLDSVDSTNSLIARAVAASEFTNASDCVEHLFERSESETQNFDAEDDRRLPISIAISDMQTKCRGRQGRTWFNKPGESLLSSWAVPVNRELLDARFSGWLTTLCGLALIDALDEVAHRHDLQALNPDNQFMLKWPNDVFCQGRKLAGILSEMIPCDTNSAVLVIGIGMNLFVAQEDLPIDMSTSLQLQYSPLPPYAELRDEIVCTTTRHLRKEFSSFMSDPAEAVPRLLERVRQRSWTLGKQVQAHLAADKLLIGRALSINDDASLTILGHDGRRHEVTTADVGVLSNASA
ncbi:biotin--[acetyl-CoA-carboxylase] ligase [Bifidobacterium aquikefiricola]|uniref:Biotin--[acetyl-CoA-carboxylase] ligase n=1 Tax=Bifidobacterium aquikefiricola TaxID=3059038 RepID=A0AB39U5J9_9BIFI